MSKTNLIGSIRNFLTSPTGPGIILMACVAISLIIANSPLGNAYEALLANEIGYHSENIHLRYSVLMWVNDGLMVIFFLLVGLEIKRELMNGELSSPKKAALPVLAAVGGVLVPALIYVFFNNGTETASGWAIPMATDIAFALAAISLLGNKVPLSLKIFLAALAIVDDLMAILVIAIFYSTELHFTYLYYALGLFILMLAMNRFGVKRIFAYLIPGILMWYFIHHSGIHATIAGVLTAMAIPTKGNGREAPLIRLEHILEKPVNLLIMPIFALANTNITFVEGMLGGLFTPLGLGIILGLFLGKPIGIFILSWISVKLGICTMPNKASWIHVLGVGMLAGIGFTMSIFIAVLSFAGQDLIMAEAKFSVLVASLLSGISGSLLLTAVPKRQGITEKADHTDISNPTNLSQ